MKANTKNEDFRVAFIKSIFYSSVGKQRLFLQLLYALPMREGPKFIVEGDNGCLINQEQYESL